MPTKIREYNPNIGCGQLSYTLDITSEAAQMVEISFANSEYINMIFWAKENLNITVETFSLTVEAEQVYHPLWEITG